LNIESRKICIFKSWVKSKKKHKKLIASSEINLKFKAWLSNWN
jgi:hypothetical protein